MANDYFDSGDYTALVANTIARSDAVNLIFAAIVTAFDLLPALVKLREGRITYMADTGAADAYVVALDIAPPSYVAGLEIWMKATNANTGASTINVNALGAVAIKRADGSALSAGDITAAGIVGLRHNGTDFTMVTNPTYGNVGTVGLPLAVASGGTGAITAAAARTALGLVIGTDVQAYDANSRPLLAW